MEEGLGDAIIKSKSDAVKSEDVGTDRPDRFARHSVADFDNDGHADLLVGVETAPAPAPQEGTTPNKLQILSGDGQGNFTVGQPIALPEVGPVHVGRLHGEWGSRCRRRAGWLYGRRQH